MALNAKIIVATISAVCFSDNRDAMNDCWGFPSMASRVDSSAAASTKTVARSHLANIRCCSAEYNARLTANNVILLLARRASMARTGEEGFIVNGKSLLTHAFNA
jgi:hypothetical protein